MGCANSTQESQKSEGNEEKKKEKVPLDEKVGSLPGYKAVLDNVVVAQSETVEIVNGLYFFPHSALNKEYFTESTTRKQKDDIGIAHHYTVSVPFHEIVDAAWYVFSPAAKYNSIKRCVCFIETEIAIVGPPQKADTDSTLKTEDVKIEVESESNGKTVGDKDTQKTDIASALATATSATTDNKVEENTDGKTESGATISKESKGKTRVNSNSDNGKAVDVAVTGTVLANSHSSSSSSVSSSSDSDSEILVQTTEATQATSSTQPQPSPRSHQSNDDAKEQVGATQNGEKEEVAQATTTDSGSEIASSSNSSSGSEGTSTKQTTEASTPAVVDATQSSSSSEDSESSSSEEEK